MDSDLQKTITEEMISEKPEITLEISEKPEITSLETPNSQRGSKLISIDDQSDTDSEWEYKKLVIDFQYKSNMDKVTLTNVECGSDFNNERILEINTELSKEPISIIIRDIIKKLRE
jgi:hypothetical protein